MASVPIIVSACLIGLRTRHDGTGAYDEKVIRAIGKDCYIPVCPEQLGGLPTPRPASEIKGGDGFGVLDGSCGVMDEYGSDLTDNFLTGAAEVLKAARATGARKAFLKEKSPSCGVASIYRDGTLVEGSGVTAALLKKEGIEVKGF